MLKYLVLFLLCLLPLKSAAQDSIVINEFMASNSSTLEDTDGDYSDWIELHNPTSQSIDISGWTLTDDEDDPSQWTFLQTTLGPGEYVVVFASGKDYFDPLLELHTNFKINNGGEYLGLFDEQGNAASIIETFPELASDVSYNYSEGEYFRSATPTPGAANEITWQEVLSPLTFSAPHGFYKDDFDLEISSPDDGVQIYYTTNGSEPDSQNSTLYTQAIPVETTSIIRAASFGNGGQSRVATSTYIFPEDVIKQTDEPEGYPLEWGEFYESEGTAPADYGMDLELTRNIKYKDSLEIAVKALPVLSIVMNKDDLFSHNPDPDSGGIYIFTGNYGSDPGKGWERAASIEFFNSPDGLDFQENIGIELHGGASRLAEKTPKHSFRLSFKEEYGETRLNYPLFGEDVDDSFNSVVLRASYGNTWLHRSASERNHTTLIHDLWGKDTQLDMGHPAGHGFFVHLYLNGMYWGIYNPTERIDAEFAARHLGGEEEHFDIIKDYGEVVSGSKISWNEMFSLSRQDMSVDANYFQLIGKNADGSDNPDLHSYLDLENFIDYMVINLYGANWDWDHHNWVAIRNRVNPGKGFKFFSWDAEHILEDINSDILDINYEARPSELFQNLMNNPHFKLLFADRIQKHFFNEGALTPEEGIKRLMKRAGEIELGIIAESMRWGDYRRDVHRDYPSGPFDLYTKDHWLDEIGFLVEDYFPNRGDVFLQQLRDAGMIPPFNAPEFLVNLQPPHAFIQMGDTLTMTPTSGDIYYTLNGADPLVNGILAPYAVEYTGPIILAESAIVKVRVLRRDQWSAVNTRHFVIRESVENLKITEIHYHPLPEGDIEGKEFEFLELKNTGNEQIRLQGLQFIEGISFEFGESVLNPGEFIVLASNKEYFMQRYQFETDGVFEGAIDNSGETLVLADANRDTLINIRYNDKSPWPERADGEGYSLVPTEVDPQGNQNHPDKWRASAEINGSPGKDDPATVSTEDESSTLPDAFHLDQNYPNPFNPTTDISFRLSANSEVSLKVYDMLGREVAVLVDGRLNAGAHSVTFNASGLSSGVYFYQINVGGKLLTRKMLLLK